MHFCFEITLVFLVCFLEIILAVPPSYCLEKFNYSDCNLAPQQVFSYDKPGSRCELETWRGCPTLNKFETEEECSNICIYIESDVANVMAIRGAVNEICLYNPIHVKRCNDNISKVYVYNSILKSCVPITWAGCPRPENVFTDEMSCVAVCSQIKGYENILYGTKTKQTDAILNSLLNNISNYVEKIDNLTMDNERIKNINEDIMSIPTSKSIDLDVKVLKVTDSPKVPASSTTQGSTLSVAEKERTPESTKTSILDTTETSTTSTSTSASTSISTSTNASYSTTQTTVSTTKTEETTVTSELTTQKTIRSTRSRGTVKQVVLPQDL